MENDLDNSSHSKYNRPSRNVRAWMIILGVLVVILGYWYWKSSQSFVVLLPDGKTVLYRGGFFRHDKCDLIREHGKWWFWSSKGLGGGELIVPFECPYNEYRTMRLENGGKVYLLDKKEMTRMELRVVNGQWSYDATDHWQSIFDLNIDP